MSIRPRDSPRHPSACVEFTHRWLTKYRSSRVEDRRQQLLGAVADPNRGEENIIMKLQLDYEIEPNYTILSLILFYLTTAGPRPRKGEKKVKFSHRVIARDSIRSGFSEAILQNISRYGYTCGLNSFDMNHFTDLCGLNDKEKFDPEPGEPVEGNILSLILEVLKCGHLKTSISEHISPEEIAQIQWSQNLIRLLLDQPTMTNDLKLKLVNGTTINKGWPKKCTILVSLVIRENWYIPIIRLLISYGADINIGTHVKCPLMQCMHDQNIELLIELILSQKNLMTINLTEKNHSVRPHEVNPSTPLTTLSYVRTTTTFFSDTILKYSTPRKLAKRIIERLYQWQQDQRKQLALNVNFQPNEAVIRDWLQNQLTTLPQQLFSSTIQYYMDELKYRPDESCRRGYVRRWIHQLQTSPNLINLVEVSGRRNTTLLADSLWILLDVEFRPYVPLVLALLKDVPFVNGLVLFGSADNHLHNIFDELIHFFDVKLLDVIVDEQERNARVDILAQLFQIVIQQLNRVLETNHTGNHREYVSQLRTLYGEVDDGEKSTAGFTDEELASQLLTSISSISERVTRLIYDTVREMGSHVSLKIFKLFWLEILPLMDEFRTKESLFKSEFLITLLQDCTDPIAIPERALISTERVTTFLADDFFQTTDFLLPMHFIPSFIHPTHIHPFEGLTLIQFIQKRFNGYSQPSSKPFLDWMLTKEHQWLTIHYPRIGQEIEEFLIHDLAALVINYLKPN